MSVESALQLRVLVLTDSVPTGESLGRLLAEFGFHTSDARTAFGQGAKALVEHRPHVAVVADTLDDPAVVVESLDAAAPDVPIVVVLPEGDVQAAHACALAGARATFMRPLEPETLAQAMAQIHARESRRRQRLAAAIPTGPHAPPPAQARVVVVHGAKGGVGTTTLACNLAAALRQGAAPRVALVDAHLERGDAGVLCDLTPERSIADLLAETGPLDVATVDGLLPEHPTGMRVLLAPESLQHAQSLDADDLQKALGAIRPFFDYVVVDTPATAGPAPLALFGVADLVLLVLTPDLLALRDAARFLRLARLLGIPDEKVLLVANHGDAPSDITPAVVQEQLQRPLGATLPSDAATLLDCMNRGELVLASRPRAKLTRAIARLAQDVVAALGQAAPSSAA